MTHPTKKEKRKLTKKIIFIYSKTHKKIKWLKKRGAGCKCFTKLFSARSKFKSCFISNQNKGDQKADLGGPHGGTRKMAKSHPHGSPFHHQLYR